MDAFKTMTIVSCVMSTITTIAMCTAILPHIKSGMVVVRDAVLWSAFVLVIAVGGWIGIERIRTNNRDVPREVVSPELHDRDDQDRYYRAN